MSGYRIKQGRPDRFYPLFSQPLSGDVEENYLVYCNNLSVNYEGWFLGINSNSTKVGIKISEDRKTIAWFSEFDEERHLNKVDYEYFYIGIGR